MISPEAAAVSLNSYLLSEAVSSIAGVAWFAQKLTETSFITRKVCDDIVLTIGFSDTDKCYRLLSAVKTQVAANPAQFHTLVDILRSEAALTCYADVITESYEIESKKRMPINTQRSSSSHSPPMVPKFMQEFGVMMCDIVQILERQKGALKRMVVAFEQMVIPMKSAAYTALVNSKAYSNVNSVQAFFKLLAPYWKPVHCPLLTVLVNATKCKAAIERLQVYLTSRQKAGKCVVLGEEGEDICVPLPDANSSVVTQGSQESFASGRSHPTESTTIRTSTCNTSEHRSLHGADSASSQNLGQTPESEVILSQPTANTDSLQISAKVAQDRVTWAEYDQKTTLICGVLRIPPFMLQFCGVKPGSVVINWITSEGLLPYILSNMMDDGDLHLLLQEKIVSIRVGSEYTITVGSPAYWKFTTESPSADTDQLESHRHEQLPSCSDVSDSSDLSEDSIQDYDANEPDMDIIAIQEEIDTEYAFKVQEQIYAEGFSAGDTEYAFKVQEQIYAEGFSAGGAEYALEVQEYWHKEFAEFANEKLWKAAASDDVTTAAMLLDGGADLNTTGGPDSTTPLYIASDRGHLRTVCLLLERGADVDKRDKVGWTALHLASWRGRLSVVKTLLEYGANVDVQTNDGRTPLMRAAREGYSDTVLELLKHGASVNIQDKGGRTALYWASWYGRFSAAKTLLEHGANVDVQDNDGDTPLMTAAWQGYSDIVLEVLKHGTSVNVQDENGRTALYWASRYGKLSVVKTLLEQGANVDVRTNQGDSTVIVATRFHHCEVMQQLIESGADLNIQNEEGLTALMIAVKSGRANLVEKLLERGCDVDVRENSTGWSALFFAAEEGDVAITNLLLKAGANALLKSKSNATALDVAEIRGQEENTGQPAHMPNTKCCRHKLCELLTQHMKESAPSFHLDSPLIEQQNIPPQKQDTPPVKQQHNVPLLQDSTSPNQHQTGSPTQPRGGISDHNVPLPQDSISPAQHQTESPTQHRGGISEHNVPLLQDSTSPNQHQTGSPTQQRGGISDHNVPLPQNSISPAQHQTESPTQHRGGISESVPLVWKNEPVQDSSTQYRGGISDTMRNAVNQAGKTITTLFNRLDRRLKSKDEKEQLIVGLVQGAGKVKENDPGKKSGEQNISSKTVPEKVQVAQYT